MTPEERDLVRGLFDRLARLEHEPRDAEAEQVIREGLTRAPNAVYALIQSVLIQEEALRLANDRIEKLEADLAEARPAPSNGSFLGSRRGASVPSSGASKWNTGAVLGGGPAEPAPGPGPRGDRPMGLPPSFGGARGGPMGGAPGGPGSRPAGPAGRGEPSGGGSFLGTAAAAAIGVIGGSILMGGLKSALGGQGAGSGAGNAAGSGAGGAGSEAKSPFADVFDRLTGDNNSPGGGGSGDLAREAGLGDIGGARQGASSQASRAQQDDDFDDDNYGEGGDDDYDDDDFDDDNYGDEL